MRHRKFRKALITGAAGGLGAALSREFAGQGTVLVLLDVNEEGLGALARNLGAGVIAHTYTADLSNLESLEQKVREVCAKHPDIDLFIANAGIDRPMSMLEGSWREMAVHMNINMLSTAVFLQDLVPSMVKNGGGHVAVIASLAALAAFPQEAPYCASKAAVSVFMESARPELLGKGIGVTSVFPGFMRTAMFADSTLPLVKGVKPEDAARLIREGIEAGRTHIHFPAAFHAGVRFFGLLPAPLRDALATRMMGMRR